MASPGSTHLREIDEKFCQCPICLQQYREPKLLPCLHRYCSDCLQQVIERNQEATVISCPECRDEFPVPTKRVDGFKTDFYMKNIIEYIQLQKSLEPEQLQECFDCSKKVKVTAYCFKCNGFLCKDCHDNHMTKRTLKDHKQHTLSLEDLKSQHMTFAKLDDLKEAPRCESHLKDLCLLCCRTCNDRPICVTCTYGSHKNHEINDVGILAAEEREKLNHELKNVSQNEDRILKMPEIVQSIKEKLSSNVREKKQYYRTQYEGDVQTVKADVDKIEADYELSQTVIESNKERELLETRKQMDEESKQIQIKYDNIFDEIKEKYRLQLEKLEHNREEEHLKSKEKLATLEKDLQTLIKGLETKQEGRLKKLHEISQNINKVIERYKNMTTSGHRILETRNNWTAVLCIPDIRKAIEPLSEDMKKEFPEVETFQRIAVSLEVTEDEGSPVNIDVVKTNKLIISGITDGGDGSIVLTGRTLAEYESHITVINMSGKLLRQKKIKGTRKEAFGHCALLSQSKVATVCRKNTLGVYDVRDGSHIEKTINDVINSWQSGVTISVATDVDNNHILVGGAKSRDVYVFDDQLNYHHTLRLPEMVMSPFGMSISQGNLLVCDNLGKKAYLVTVGELEGKIIHEFKKPKLGKDYGRPLSVCTDSNGFIYILWTTGNDTDSGRGAVAQYYQYGRQLLAATQIDCNDAARMATIKTGNTEKLVVASLSSGKLYIYNLT